MVWLVEGGSGEVGVWFDSFYDNYKRTFIIFPDADNPVAEAFSELMCLLASDGLQQRYLRQQAIVSSGCNYSRQTSVITDPPIDM